VTACGNFGIGSSSTGDIYMWNMQSGMKRKSFNIGPCPPEAVDRFRPSTKKGSERCVTGLETDSLNRVVIASTLDGTINVRFSSMSNPRLVLLIVATPQFFDFHSTKLEHTLVLPSTAVSILLHRDSGLLAAVCDDMVVRIVDIETRRIVRELGGFRGRVLDIVGSLGVFFIQILMLTLPRHFPPTRAG
jgi:U3 small nucleolar RNA-associated protein 21